MGVDVASRDLGKARDRLHTLVFEHPDDLLLRERLAEVYDSLQQPAQAGRYWYLVEPRDDRMTNARAAYERLVGKDPLQLLAGLKFRGDEDALAEIVAKVIAENPAAVQDFKQGKKRAIGFLVGQVMKATRGKANPGIVNQKLQEVLRQV